MSGWLDGWFLIVTLLSFHGQIHTHNSFIFSAGAVSCIIIIIIAMSGGGAAAAACTEQRGSARAQGAWKHA
jgi:hypothetical protein